MRALAALLVVSGCAVASPPAEPFGVTMVEETACVGEGGRIVMGADGAFCQRGAL